MFKPVHFGQECSWPTCTCMFPHPFYLTPPCSDIPMFRRPHVLTPLCSDAPMFWHHDTPMFKHHTCQHLNLRNRSTSFTRSQIAKQEDKHVKVITCSHRNSVRVQHNVEQLLSLHPVWKSLLSAIIEPLTFAIFVYCDSNPEEEKTYGLPFSSLVLKFLTS